MTKTQIIYNYDIAFNSDLICGVDEAGRGPIAGPVVCAAVIMPYGDGSFIEGIFDSKTISEKKRVELCEKIKTSAISYSVSVIDVATIEAINILQATKMGMIQAIEGLSVIPNKILVDGNDNNLGFNRPYTPIIKGDSKSYAIAAASILAKVTRDNIMINYSKQYPQYGLEKHKGYGTAAHYAAIKTHGMCAIHRVSWIKEK